MNRKLDELTDAELAEWQYAHRDQLEAEEGDPVEFEIASQVSVTMSFRLSGTEADAIRKAAHEAGMSLSEWIRQAAAHAISPDDGRNRQRDVEFTLLTAERQLHAARKRLEAARKNDREPSPSKRSSK